MKAFLSKVMREARKLSLLPRSLLEMHDLVLNDRREKRIHASPNPFNKFGAKYFSQSDEDGLTLEIVRRLGISQGNFIEFGVGNGLENNTTILIASGWKGVWIGGEKLKFKTVKSWSTFKYLRAWVDLVNIDELYTSACTFLRGAVNVVSIDLDGNDIYFVENILLGNSTPDLFICEFNGKFPLPITFAITYNPRHTWKHDDYFGCSLQAYIDLFARYSYFLVVVNGQTGLNAFFVKEKYRGLFPDLPNKDSDKWIGASYELHRIYLHPASPNTIVSMIERNESTSSF